MLAVKINNFLRIKSDFEKLESKTNDKHRLRSQVLISRHLLIKYKLLFMFIFLLPIILIYQLSIYDFDKHYLSQFIMLKLTIYLYELFKFCRKTYIY